MLKPYYTRQFNKDLDKIKKSGQKDIEKLKFILTKLVNQEHLDHKYKDHKLIGNYKGCRECHIEPDWLLIYTIENDTIFFERTGSHSELFE
ncbi:MAG: damage-inducible protein [Spirochaetes bacterium GWB1_27_13]|nr:MAG: damage-inducible protein [Spirochaetes bacterium GWB1_27_13]